MLVITLESFLFFLKGEIVCGQVFPADSSLPQEHRRQQQQPTPTPSLPPQMPPQPQPQPQSDDTAAAAAKLAGWDLTDDMEALLNDDADDFYS